MKIQYAMISLSVVGLLGGCGAAKKASVQRAPIEAGAVQVFEPRDMRLSTNAAFLWKKDVVHQQVSRMSKAGDAFGLSRGKFGKIQADLSKLPERKELEESRDAAAAKVKELDAALRDPNVVDRDALQEQLKGAKAKLEASSKGLAARDALEKAKKETLEALANAQVEMATLGDNVVFPQMIEIKFGSTTSIHMLGWMWNGVQSNISTDDSIREVSYQPKGGLLRFKIDTGDGYQVAFRLARNKYHLEAQGTVSFAGEIVATSGGQTRVGMAKFLGAYVK